jgi:hypothetical protein
VDGDADGSDLPSARPRHSIFLVVVELLILQLFRDRFGGAVEGRAIAMPKPVGRLFRDFFGGALERRVMAMPDLGAVLGRAPTLTPRLKLRPSRLKWGPTVVLTVAMGNLGQWRGGDWHGK